MVVPMMKSPPTIHLLLALIFLTSTMTMTGCSGLSTQTTRRAERGFVRLEVEPATATVYINESYQGVLSQWLRATIPVPPGLVRLELRAPGYITQRFDLEVEVNEEVTLTLKMEPTLDAIKGATPHGR